MPDKRKVLFVDDEENVLSGLKRMLRSLRKEMEMHFALSGAEALELMDEHHFDVVISDMRMPFMDGATLLTAIKKRSPATIRIVLSGEADAEAICRTIDVAHQYLAKPCDSQVLTGIIKRARDLHGILVDNALKSIVSDIESLPAMPELYAKLQNALRKPEVSSEEIGGIISQDVAMTAKILQLVNSSFFGILQKVDTPSRAVSLLGIETVKVLILGLRLFDDITDEVRSLLPENMWSHSLATANCAKLIAQMATDDTEKINNCFVAGLLHDIGRLVLASKMAAEYEKACEIAKATGKDLLVCEQEILGTTHADIGAYLVGLWGFNSDILEAVAFHSKLQQYQSTIFSPALAVHLGNVASRRALHYNGDNRALEPNWAYLGNISMSDEARKWLEECQTALESTLGSER